MDFNNFWYANSEETLHPMAINLHTTPVNCITVPCEMQKFYSRAGTKQNALIVVSLLMLGAANFYCSLDCKKHK